MTRIYAILAGTIVVAGLGGIWASTVLRGGSDDQFAECRVGQVGGGAIGGPFELMDKDGNIVTDKDVITEPSLLYFGYTFCPDVCPLDTTRNADAVDLLEQQGKIVTPVFISIDPARDTPEVVGEFAETLHDRMVGLTGTPEQVKAASKAYKTYYKAHSAEDEYYLVDHSTFTYLVLPDHGFVEFFRRDIEAPELAEKVGCFVDRL